MGYMFLFAFVASEWKAKQPLVFYWLFFTALNLIVSLILLEFE